MAEYYADIATKQLNPKGSNLLDGRTEFNRRLTLEKVVIDTDVLTALATGDIVNLMKLPKGAKINPNLSYVVTVGSVFGSSLTIDIGTDTVDNILSDDLDVNATGRDQFNVNAEYELTADEWVIATLAASGALGASKTLTFYIAVIWP